MSNINFTKPLPLWSGVSAAIPMVVAQSNVASTTGDAETIDVTGSSLTIPKGFFAPGMAFRFTLAGSRTGTAGASTIVIDINGTDVISLAVPTNTAVDWTAQFVVCEHTNFKNQNCFGTVHASATVLSISDYAAATVDVSEETVIKAQMTLANASDSVTCSYVLVECWIVEE
jgi:hypothetical protein